MMSCVEHVKVHVCFTWMEAVVVIQLMLILHCDLSITNRDCELPELFCVISFSLGVGVSLLY